MTEKLDKKLCEKYPKIFANRFNDMRTTAMCWGFECDDGWYNLIDRLCSNLQWNTDHNNKEYVIKNKRLRKFVPFLLKTLNKIPGKYNFDKKSFNLLANIKNYLISNISKWRNNLKFIHIESNKYPQIIASQVKEKFGGLRFYVEGATNAQYAVISFAETLSEYTCEECGSMKDIGRTTGWIKTLCYKCGCTLPNWKLDTEEKNDNK